MRIEEKTLPINKNLTIDEKDFKGFVKYLNDFYGKKGVYPNKFGKDLQPRDIIKAIDKVSKSRPKHQWDWDSLDRELVRDELIDMRVFDYPTQESAIKEISQVGELYTELEIDKDEMEKLHKDGEVEVDGEKVSYEKSINEADVVGKTIFSDGKGKLFFGYYKTDGGVTFVDYKTWKKLSFKDVSKGDTNKERVIKSILKGQKQFNKKVEFNMWAKQKKRTFEETMDWFIQNGWISNINKGGIKESVNESEVTEAKSFEFTIYYNTGDDDKAYVEEVLRARGVRATVEYGTLEDDIIIKTKNAAELRKAKKVIKADGFKINESAVNEIQYKDAVAKFNDELIKHPMVKKAAQHYKKTPAEIVKVLQQRLSTKGNRGGDTKEVSIDFKDTDSGINVKHKKSFNESVNERYTGNSGDKLKHKYDKNIEIELIEPTNKGWKVYQTDKGNKRKIAYFDKQDIVGNKSLFESVNEATSSMSKEIASMTGTRQPAVQQFIDKHNINALKLAMYLNKQGLRGRMDFTTALSGKPGNPIQNKMIKMFQESVNEVSIPQLAKLDAEHLDRHVGGKSEKEVRAFVDRVYKFYPKDVRKYMSDAFIHYQRGNVSFKYFTTVLRVMHQDIRESNKS